MNIINRKSTKGINAYPADESLIPKAVVEFIDTYQEVGHGGGSPAHRLLELAGKEDEPMLENAIELGMSRRRPEFSEHEANMLRHMLENDYEKVEYYAAQHQIRGTRGITYITSAVLLYRKTGKEPRDPEACERYGYDVYVRDDEDDTDDEDDGYERYDTINSEEDDEEDSQKGVLNKNENVENNELIIDNTSEITMVSYGNHQVIESNLSDGLNELANRMDDSYSKKSNKPSQVSYGKYTVREPTMVDALRELSSKFDKNED